MAAMILSPEYQLTIPKELRDDKLFPPGTKFEALVYDGRFTIVAVRPISEMRGRFKLKDSDVEREEEDRL